MSKPSARSIYTLKGPCSNCPFRSDQPFYLHDDRVAEIGQSLRDGATFYCHKTLDYGDGPDTDECEADDDGNSGSVTSRARACAGALATMEKEGRPNQIMRIGQRLGFYDPAHLDADAPVHSSLAEWAAARRADNAAAAGPHRPAADAQYCEVVHDQDCLNPAAYSGPYGIEESLRGPATTTECSQCANVVCRACASNPEAGAAWICKRCDED